MSHNQKLLERIEADRKYLDSIRPAQCCVKQPMRTSDGKVTYVCALDCPWQDVDLELANDMIDAELGTYTND